jgi:asparagine synthase (glutamine-hydrolysing)
MEVGMCGFAGLSLARPEQWADDCVRHMTASIAHRGPDSDGFYANTDGTVQLGFRRLAIRDLDPRANQPMQTASRRTVGVFNGEVYNTRDLAPRFCPDVTLRTTGDTEVFLEAFERHGSTIFPECNGMFATAFCDVDSRQIVLTRDRAGKKPLYIYEGDGFVAFASELRCFAPFQLEFDPESLPYYLRFGFYPAPMTAFRRTTALRPGEAINIRDGAIVARQRWHDFTQLDWGTVETADIDQIESTVRDAVSIRMLSDVPVGAFLSGGIDSSLVAAELKAAGHTGVPMFTVAFDSESHNEAPFAAQVAQHLGLPHVELSIPPESLPGMVSDFVDCYEQPYADSSGLPSMLLCRNVREYVTVALCGDGGDEFFGGYRRYNWLKNALRARRFPRTFRRLAGGLLGLQGSPKARRIQRVLDLQDYGGIYAELFLGWWPDGADSLLTGVSTTSEAPAELIRDVFSKLNCDPISKAQCADAAFYLPDCLQVKMDRAAMRYSLEVRCPLLDFRVTTSGARLSREARMGGSPKQVLKQLLGRHIPRETFERPKQGFGVPMQKWLRGPLQELLVDSLNAQSFREAGWLRHDQVQQMLTGFQNGEHWRASQLWGLLALALSIERHTSSTQNAVDFRARSVA